MYHLSINIFWKFYILLIYFYFKMAFYSLTTTSNLWTMPKLATKWVLFFCICIIYIYNINVYNVSQLSNIPTLLSNFITQVNLHFLFILCFNNRFHFYRYRSFFGFLYKIFRWTFDNFFNVLLEQSFRSRRGKAWRRFVRHAGR